MSLRCWLFGHDPFTYSDGRNNLKSKCARCGLESDEVDQ